MRVLALASLVFVASAALFAAGASADRTFHTLHAELTAVGAEPLQSGFVNDVHTNGTVNSALEIYHLTGASPDTTYQVTIHAYPGDPTCSSAPLTIPTAQVTTNGVGNGNARFTFPVGPPTGLEGLVSGIRWIFTGPAGPAYATACAPLTLD